VLLAVNMQTSFMHPPFGFALFYLRSVAPEKEYVDRVTQKIAPVTTMQIYWGAVPFVLIQMVMVGLIIAFPGIVSRRQGEKLDLDKVGEQMREQLQPESNDTDGGYGANEEPGTEPAAPAEGGAMPEPGAEPAPGAPEASADDPLKALQDSLKPKSP
jgi:hypothetical protein